jgi:hypothetical protein
MPSMTVGIGIGLGSGIEAANKAYGFATLNVSH